MKQTPFSAKRKKKKSREMRCGNALRRVMVRIKNDLENESFLLFPH